jgi:hypothetical protein
MIFETHPKSGQNAFAFDSNEALSKINYHPLFAVTTKTKAHIRDPKQKGFLDLPGEIRNQIYRLCFVRKQHINGRRTKFPTITLLQLCKKVNEEASSILYFENTFTFGILLNFTNLQRMGLHCFPLRVDVWPAKTYHKWLRKLHIGISFSPGGKNDFSAPAFLLDDINAMRKAYDDCWEDLDITWELCEGTAHLLTFTMAWLKFRCFEPLAHPNCTVNFGANGHVSPIVAWCLRRTLTGCESKVLHEEQVAALQEARQIAEDSYLGGMHKVCNDLSWRLVWGCPIESTRGPIFNHANPFGAPVFAPIPIRRRIYDQRDMYRHVETTMTDKMATDTLLEDNEWRILCALDMPEEKDLLIGKAAELRTYFVLQEMATKFIALEESLKIGFE